MADIDKAVATQLSNIEKRTGRSLAELTALINKSGLTKHGDIVALLKTTLGMGHGDANTLVHTVKRGAAAPPSSADDALAAIYTGPKAHLRPVHDRLMAAIRDFGPFEEAPKQTYISLRRKRQFAMIGPATNTSVEVGLNMKGADATDRLVALPAGRMCNYRVRIATVDEVDAELISWIRTAYQSAG